jgi:uncharacterized protein YqeY
MAMNKYKTFSATLILGIICSMSSVTSVLAAQKVYYRYVDEYGVQVINHSIPPEYVQNGYEVVTISGKVLKTVDAALTPEAVERQAKAREHARVLNEWDRELKRRYSSVHDIEAAKQRKLSELQGNISILNSNVRNLKKQIVDQQSVAASSERQGRKVSPAVLSALSGLEEELKLTKKLIEDRESQLLEMSNKYDRDKERFSIIRPSSN